MEKEIWKEVPGYPKYQVSNLGRVMSMDYMHTGTGVVLKPHGNIDGYNDVTLFLNGNKKMFKIHQLVAMAFLGHKPNGFDMVVNHKDFNRQNNNVSNLEIVTTRENTNLKHIASSSEYTGVSWHKGRQKWQANITLNKRQIYLGLFTSELEASKYYENALEAIKNGTKIKIKRNTTSSKYKGVSWDRKNNKWYSRVFFNGKYIHLGRFKTELEAHEYQKEAEFSLKNNLFIKTQHGNIQLV